MTAELALAALVVLNAGGAVFCICRLTARVGVRRQFAVVGLHRKLLWLCLIGETLYAAWFAALILTLEQPG
jgi:hypothetical protein